MDTNSYLDDYDEDFLLEDTPSNDDGIDWEAAYAETRVERDQAIKERNEAVAERDKLLGEKLAAERKLTVMKDELREAKRDFNRSKNAFANMLKEAKRVGLLD